MACGCKKGAKRETFKVRLSSGIEITKSSEAAAVAFSAKHPGSKVIKK